MPRSLSAAHRSINLAHQKPVNAFDHLGREVAIACQRFCSRKSFDRRCERSETRRCGKNRGQNNRGEQGANDVSYWQVDHGFRLPRTRGANNRISKSVSCKARRGRYRSGYETVHRPVTLVHPVCVELASGNSRARALSDGVARSAPVADRRHHCRCSVCFAEGDSFSTSPVARREAETMTVKRRRLSLPVWLNQLRREGIFPGPPDRRR